MFLKRIEIQGFKSFADKVIINFDDKMTGIVGPNGCGKSNITDAIRWVLGEQSVKSLRGNSMSDIIFSGSANRKMVNYAEVILVFDNTSKFLNSELEEIEITRRIYRNGKDGEYLINRNACRLKDIHNLILDTGLGKDSLSIISQGNISTFADAKPVDRREIFEEAAGVSKYKKRKIDTLRNLDRTQSNLERAKDILSELEKQVGPLKRQAKKAETYIENKSKLEDIEITVLVNEISELNSKIDSSNDLVLEIESAILMQETSIQVNDVANQQLKKEISSVDLLVNQLQEKLMKIINEIQILETRKIEIDEKRKYAIEVGNTQEKISELKIYIEEAKYEFDDRSKRLIKATAETELLNIELQSINNNLATASNNVDQSSNTLRNLQNRLEVLKNISKDPFNSQAGVKSIINNLAALNGILGVVGQNSIPDRGYEQAIAESFGGSMMNIVTVDEQSARLAINFLKRNQSGRATFLPTTVLKSHHLSQDAAIICENTKGYLGVGSSFITCPKVFEIVSLALLQNVIITDNLENGNILANLLKFNYKIVTIDGDVIHKGGSMSGGKIKNSTSIMTVDKEMSDIKEKLISLEANVSIAKNKYLQFANSKSQLEQNLMSIKLQAAQLGPVVDAKRAKYERLKNEYDLIAQDNNIEGETINLDDSIISQLNSAYSNRDNMTTEIKIKREHRIKLAQDSERRDVAIRQIRKEFALSTASLNAIQIDNAKISTHLENTLNRLASEYKLTYEFALTKVSENPIEDAKSEVVRLRQLIESLGNINMDAPVEYEAVSERYEFMNKQVNDLDESREKILNAIDEMDGIMVKKFSEVFNLVNDEFDTIFKALFGGGSAKLMLEDPSDILNTGIDINVQPPGKSVKNIRLLSGGEKSLIAICVLFAILRIKTIPLCIFDEVEAALDQGNVERFARYITKFKDETQFIIVTHRPGTMEQCDVLYGVTMQKQGVSQMLKVKLTDAIDIAKDKKGDE